MTVLTRGFIVGKGKREKRANGRRQKTSHKSQRGQSRSPWGAFAINLTKHSGNQFYEIVTVAGQISSKCWFACMHATLELPARSVVRTLDWINRQPITAGHRACYLRLEMSIHGFEAHRTGTVHHDDNDRLGRTGEPRWQTTTQDLLNV